MEQITIGDFDNPQFRIQYGRTTFYKSLQNRMWYNGIVRQLKMSFYFSGKYTNLRVNNVFHGSLYKSLFV